MRVSRRGLLRGTGIGAALTVLEAGVGIRTADAEAIEVLERTDQRAWMTTWLDDKGAERPLYLYRFADPCYALVRPIPWKPEGSQIRQLKFQRALRPTSPAFHRYSSACFVLTLYAFAAVDGRKKPDVF